MTLIYELTKITKKAARLKCYYCLEQAEHFYSAKLLSETFRSTIRILDAENLSHLINGLFNEGLTTPNDFMKPTDDTANKAIDEYNKFKEGVDHCPFDKRVIQGLSKWLAGSTSETIGLRSDLVYILTFGPVILSKEFSLCTEVEYKECIDEITNIKSSIFMFQPFRVRRSFNIAVRKFIEIEQKINQRK